MKVGELIKKLESFDKDRIVIMQKDSEGNGYSPLEGLWSGSYEEESTWSGYMGLEELTEEDIKDGYGDGDVVDGQKAVCLYPVN